MAAIRIGLLGAARIAPNALIRPAREVDGVTVAAVAARDPARARAFAAKHGVGRVHDSYDALIADPGIDAIYNPLPNGLHASWTLRALAAGKHVLCEKPFTANAEEAGRVAAAQGSLVVMEAFHYRYHPLMARLTDLVAEIGPVRRIESSMCFPLPRFGDIRYNFDLAGGALMDAGCYAIHLQRTLGPGEPTVTAARARPLRRDPRVDRAMTVELAFPDGATGRVRTSMWSSTLLNISARVTGERGQVSVLNFAAPQYFHRVRATVNHRRYGFRVPGDASYTYQLRAFRDAVAGATTNLTPPEDSIATMSLIDAAYVAAGLPIRPTIHNG
jgi:predicted dehydrogenase